MIIDIIIIALLLLCTFIGYKRGLVNVIFKIFAFLVALVVTIILYRPVANLVIDNTQIDEKIEAVIIENGTKETENSDKEANMTEYIQKYVEKATTDAQNEIVTSSARAIAENVVGIGVMIVLFIVIRIALTLVRFITDALANLPVVKQFNEIGGALYGLIEALVIIYVILAVIFFIVSLNGGTNLLNMIDSSFIGKMMYGNNIILKILF